MSQVGGDRNFPRWLLFVAGGCINTGFTYVLYLMLKLMLSYQFSYAIAYVSGIIFSYWFNARVVFSVPLSWRGIFSYPLVYLIQYLMSALILEGMVKKLSFNESFAPLMVALVMVPISFIMSKLVLSWKIKRA